MRVIAGTAGSIPLITPKGEKTRPTIDKHKETLFNCLTGNLYDCIFLDLYSGSGGIGIEALSRGAKRAYFVENDKEALRCIKENIKKTHMEDRAVILGNDVKQAVLYEIREPADVIFMDPPFALHAEEYVIPLVMENNRLCEDGIIVCECESDTTFDYLDRYGLQICKNKEYKSCKHVFIQRKDSL